MSEFKPGLEGVVAFETEIAEPDREGGALRYRGVDIEDLAGHVSFGHVWGLLVDNEFSPGLPPAEPYPIPVHSGDIRVDVQSALAMLAPAWGMRQLLDISDDEARDDLARASVMALSFVAQAARGLGLPMVPQGRVNEAHTITERFMIRWRGEPDPKHVQAVDAYWTSAAEHGMNASTFFRSRHHLDGCRRGGRALGRRGRDVRTAPRRRALARAPHARRRRAAGRRRRLRQGRPRQGRPAHGLRPPRLPRRGPPRPRAPLGLRAPRRPALRGGRRAREGRAGGAARAPTRPRARDQCRVLGGSDPRLRRGAAVD